MDKEQHYQQYGRTYTGCSYLEAWGPYLEAGGPDLETGGPYLEAWGPYLEAGASYLKNMGPLSGGMRTLPYPRSRGYNQETWGHYMEA